MSLWNEARECLSKMGFGKGTASAVPFGIATDAALAAEGQSNPRKKFLKLALGLLITTLREIFDESAYARFLQRTKVPSSPAAYATFWREREGKAPKPRCC